MGRTRCLSSENNIHLLKSFVWLDLGFHNTYFSSEDMKLTCAYILIILIIAIWITIVSSIDGVLNIATA